MGLLKSLVVFALLPVFSVFGVAQAEALNEQSTQRIESINSSAKEVSAALQSHIPESKELLEYCPDGWGSEESCDKLSRDVKLASLSPGLVKVALSTYLEGESTEERIQNFGRQKDGDIRRSKDTLSKEIEESTTNAHRESHEGLKGVVNEGKDIFSKSEGKVEDEEVRNSLQERLEKAQGALEEEPASPSERISSIDDLDTSKKEVEEAVSGTKGSMKDWEEARQAEVEAQRLQEISQREAEGSTAQTGNSSASISSAQASTASTAPEAAPSGPTTYHLSSSHCADPYAAQGCIDGSGVSTVNFTEMGGPVWIGGHSSGAAGVILSFKVGDIVVVSGSGAGTYQITGVGWLDKVPGQEPSILGTGYAFQTCSGNQMKVLYANKVG